MKITRQIKVYFKYDEFCKFKVDATAVDCLFSENPEVLRKIIEAIKKHVLIGITDEIHKITFLHRGFDYFEAVLEGETMDIE